MALIKYISPCLLIIFLIIHCTSPAKVKKQDLTTNQWQFRKVGSSTWHEATVPGDIISDLWKQNLIPDPFFRFNEDSVQWIEDEDWEYKTSFAGAGLDKHSLTYLVFSGLDTYADVFLNDSLILQSDNMFRTWKLDITSLIEHRNELRLHFHSPTKMERDRLDRLGYLPINVNERADKEERTRIFSRKAPFHYGWDWGPRLVTSGIWRPVELLQVSSAHIEKVYFKPLTVTETKAEYEFQTVISSRNDATINLAVHLDDSVYHRQTLTLKPGENLVNVPIRIENPKLWWCHGYGEPNLYSVQIELSAAGLYDVYQHNLGVRSLKLVQEPDSVGRSFYFELNDIPIFAKGANYIPNETLTTRITRSTYERVIRDALGANMNMLRVWGGAIYENEVFYELCDKNGILVWQDFMFACESTPPTDYMFKSIEQEAIDNVVRLRNHPCIALWCGDNENLHAWHNWGWDQIHGPKIDSMVYAGYRHIATEILPRVVGSYHPEIAYWSSSPASFPGDRLADRLSGDEHDWTIWFGQRDFEAYGEQVPRFVSEYGVQSMPPMKTVDAFTESIDLDLESEVMDHRQRSNFSWLREGMNGNDVILEYITRYFHQPNDFKSTVYLSQMMHALALKTGITLHRKNKPYCMGSLYWQLNDCWPTISWASVDYFGRWKAPHYAVRQAFDTVLIIPEWHNNDLKVFICSDHPDLNRGLLRIYEFPLSGAGGLQLRWQGEATINFTQTHSVVGIEGLSKEEDMGFYLELTYGNSRQVSNILLPDRPKHLDWPRANISHTLRATDQGLWELILVSDSFAYGVRLDSPSEIHYSDNYFSLLPGIAKRVLLTADQKELQPELQIHTYADFID